MNKIFTLLAFAASCSGAFAASTDVNPDKTGMTMNAQEWCKNVSAGWNLGGQLARECRRNMGQHDMDIL